MQICFATNNENKLKEIRHQLGGSFRILGLKEIGHFEELPEHQDTLEGNSLEKAQFIFNKYHINCFADDTGLLVKALKNEPGVNSARYAGPEKDSKANIALLLRNLDPYEDCSAKFVTVITLILNGDVKQFTGEIKGTIIKNLKGDNGFGYDPVFIPEGYEKTFAELTLDEKNKVSHRARAFKQLIEYLKKN